MTLVILSLFFSVFINDALALLAGNGSAPQNNTNSGLENQTSVVDHAFPYIIPYTTTQSCDIFGPICQPGEITLSALDKNGQPAQTTLPCSSYLASQSTYVHELAKAANLETYEIRNPGPGGPTSLQEGKHEWERKFGRSPQCTSYAELLKKNPGLSPYTFSQCPKDAVGTVSSGDGDYSLPSQVPPGVIRGPEGLRYSCCSDCYFGVFQFRLFYFKERGMENYCRSQGRNTTHEELSAPHFVDVSSNGGFVKRNASMIENNPGASVVTVSGVAMTSPSMYLQVAGTVAAFDKCGTLGTPVVDPIVAVSSGGLSTYERSPIASGELIRSIYTGEVGWNGVTPSAMQQYIKSLNVNDLDCPTYGVGFSTDAQGEEHATVGAPWLPFIIAPPELLSLNSFWNDYPHSSCQFAIAPVYDPPRALGPVDGSWVAPTQPSAADPTPQSLPAESSTDPAIQPGLTPTAGLPVNTKISDPPAASPVAGNPGTDHSPPGQNPPAEQPPARNPPAQNPPVQNPPAGNPPLQRPPTNSPPTAQGPPSDQDPNYRPAGSNPNPGPNPDPNPGVGEAVANGINGNIPPEHADSAPQPGVDEPPTPIQPATVGDQSFIPAATGFTVGDTTIKPGMAATIAGTRIFLASSGKLIVGEKTINVQPVAAYSGSPARSPFPVLTAGGHAFQAALGGFEIAGKSVVPGGIPVTVSGTRISLGPSGNLVVGSQTLSLNPGGSTTFPTLTAGGRAFVANPRGFLVAGSLVLPGGHAITVSGTVISLGPSGNLLIGSKTLSLQYPTATPLPTLTALSQLSKASPNGFVINGTTIYPGSSAVTISGTVVSLAPSGRLIIGSKTYSLGHSVSGIVEGSTTLAEAAVTVTPTGSAVLSEDTSRNQTRTNEGTSPGAQGGTATPGILPGTASTIHIPGTTKLALTALWMIWFLHTIIPLTL